ncbi:MAG: hypothetical protein ACKO0V_14120, partial [bacterium]
MPGTLTGLLLLAAPTEAADLLTALPLLSQAANAERISGFYMNIAKFLPALALFLIWVPTVWWVDDDSNELGLEKAKLFTTLILFAGGIGLLVLLLVPNIIVGIAVMSLA